MVKKKNKLNSNFKSNSQLLILALPGIIYLFIFAYLPLPGLVLAFKNFIYSDGIFRSPWVGLDNFRFLFITDAAFRITKNTVLMNIAFIITGHAFSITIALLIYELTSRSLIKIYQTIIILPNFLSWVIVSFMFYGIMNSQYGLLNNIFNSFGLESIEWYSRPKLWPTILIITSLWKAGGMGSILYFATLMGINKEYYEAAVLDGATKLQMVRYISLPFLYPMIILLMIIGIGGMIRADFGMFYNLTRDVPMLYPTTDVIDTYVFRALRSTGDTGMAAAAGLYQSVVGFFLILITNYIIRKKSPENSLF